MKIYSVFVRVCWQNPNWQPTVVARYIDSQWAREDAAKERKRELEDSFAAFGCFSTANGATCLIVAGSVTDVALTPEASRGESQ